MTLNRPDQLNAVNSAMIAELVDAFGRADADDSVRAVIVSGAGRAFCAGADLSRGAGTFDHGAAGITEYRDGGGQASLAVHACRKPVIAAVNGAAVGFGATFTLPMDVRLASTEARFGFVFTRRGVVPEACSSWFLPRVVGVSQALEWFTTGRVFGASEAHAAGLVRSVHAPGELPQAATALAHEMIDQTSAVSVAAARRMVFEMLGAPAPLAAHRLESRLMYLRGGSAAAREGVSSFLEKRSPEFRDQVSAEFPGLFG